MKTPIFDYVKGYKDSDSVRLHMPGHKGVGALGCEGLDITEIDGADVLYEPSGIIAESEENATSLFATGHTYYSTEGSSLSIKAMLAIACKTGDTVLAARNAHKAFLYAAALLDLSVDWLYPSDASHVCVSQISPDALESALKDKNEKPSAVYITSPDYLGNMADIRGLSAVCKRYGVPLLVDNAHGAYLAFLSPSLHPIALGATMACDSAHKTLPTLTGGAYLHLSPDAPKAYFSRARQMLSLFSSSSPSYLILSSLDCTNRHLKEDARNGIAAIKDKLASLKKELSLQGYCFSGDEPLKLTLRTASYGYFADEVATYLKENGIVAEFYDREYLVLMASAQTDGKDLERLMAALSRLPRKAAFELPTPTLPLPIQKMSIREALFAEAEVLSLADAIGKVCAAPALSCPPCVPILVSGEQITEECIRALRHYGITRVSALKTKS